MSRLWMGLMTSALALSAQSSALDPVLQSELAFARLAVEQGIRPAFRTWLTGTAWVFTPRMTPAKAQYEPEPGDGGHLVWYPEAMGISTSGDLAWSMGPWTYSATKGAPILVQGHFLSLWRKQAQGGWRVVADIGVPHPAPAQPSERFAGSEMQVAQAKPVMSVPMAEARVRAREAELTQAWAQRGGSGLTPMLAREARVLRPGRSPLRGALEIQAALAADLPCGKGDPAKVDVALGGDLAWTCGETGPDGRGQTASFLRIWTLEAGDWKVLFDVRLPIPKPTP